MYLCSYWKVWQFSLLQDIFWQVSSLKNRWCIKWWVCQEHSWISMCLEKTPLCVITWPFHRWQANQSTDILVVWGFNAWQFATYFQFRAELLFQHPSLQFLHYSCSVHIIVHSCNFPFQLPEHPCIHCSYPAFKKSVHNTVDFLLITLICGLLRTVLLSFAETVWSVGSVVL